MTPAIRAAERAGIIFEVLEYVHRADAESYGLEAAEALGLPPGMVFKTLVARMDGHGLIVGMVPVDRSLDLKALAAACGGKRAEMAQIAEAERATGYVAGGISPIGQRRRLPAVLDSGALALERIAVSGGRRGLQICLAPADLMRLAGAGSAPIAR